MALGMTALVFFGLSAYAILSRKDFSFLSGFIMAGCIERCMNMQEHNTTLQHAGVSEAEVSKLFRNTYSLLALTLAFSAIVAFVSMSLNLPYPGIIITLVGFYGLLFLTTKLRNSGWGL
ncbi:UNVERIFIED_CONTAM: hypothetical protein NCL1_56116, partial [Trichonephila clavipes]